MSDCVFCDIIDGLEPAEVVITETDYLCIKPIKPVVDGHLLFIPRTHYADAIVSPAAAAMLGILTEAAARWAWALGLDDCNIITSAGPAATQTVPHLHVHLVPRQADDGLRLPWGKLAHEHTPKPRRGTLSTESTTA